VKHFGENEKYVNVFVVYGGQVWHNDDVDCIPACCISGTRVIPVDVAGVLAVKYRLDREPDDRSNDFDSISHANIHWIDTMMIGQVIEMTSVTYPVINTELIVVNLTTRQVMVNILK